MRRSLRPEFVVCWQATITLCVTVACGFAVSAQGAEPRLSVAALTVSPASVILSGPRAQARLLVSATLADGSQIDVTDKAVFVPVRPDAVRVDADGVLHPRKDGATAVRVAYGGRSVRATVSVRNAQGRVPVSFTNEIEPILTVILDCKRIARFVEIFVC